MSHKKVLFSVALLIFLGSLEKSIVTTPLPVIGQVLNATEHLTWVITAYLITATSIIPICGKLSDLWGRIKVINISLVIFIVGSLLCSFATTLEGLIIARAIQGIGGGGLISLAFIVISDVIPAREVGKYQGYISLIYVVSNVTGPILGSLLTEFFSWRMIFAINLPLGLLAIYIITKTIKPGTSSVKRNLDWLGAAFFTTSTGLVILLVGGYINLSPLFLLIALGWILLSVIYLVVSKRPSLIPWHMFKLDNYLACLCLMGASQIIMMVGLVYFPLHMQWQEGISLVTSGYAMILFTLGICAGAYVAGKQIARTGYYKNYIVVGFLLNIISFILLSQKILLISLFPIVGFGLGCTLPALTCAVQNVLPVSDRGIGMSFFGYVRELSGTLGIAMFASVGELAVGFNLSVYAFIYLITAIITGIALMGTLYTINDRNMLCSSVN
ncbi:MFS transporter [Zooshikella sp. RANM57]|uniref:MFS transporter n=1 Tax=Zooshikella sp. RANM57 TaxID=3425863 RepID=UPI003D6DCF4B